MYYSQGEAEGPENLIATHAVVLVATMLPLNSKWKQVDFNKLFSIRVPRESAIFTKLLCFVMPVSFSIQDGRNISRYSRPRSVNAASFSVSMSTKMKPNAVLRMMLALVSIYFSHDLSVICFRFYCWRAAL